MRTTAILDFVALSVIAGQCMLSAAEMTVPEVTVGRYLQTAVSVRLPDSKPRENLKLTITSDDPNRLLLSDAPDKAGAPSIVVTVLPQFIESPLFWLQSRADSGSATYTVTCERVGSVKGAVKLAPSAIVIVGPYRAPKFSLTSRAEPARITVVAAGLTSEGKVGAEQQLAGGSRIEVAVSNSDPKVGTLLASSVVLTGGASTGSVLLKPVGEGETTLTPVQPAGFRAAKEYASVTASIAKPGLAIDGEIYLGKDLQVAGTLLLGEPAPPGGIDVTIKSLEPSKLVLALRQDQQGEPSIQVHVPAGQFTAPYFIQALADTGIVNYEAQAPGYRPRVARVGLAPSGIIIAYDHYGPPDEAAVLRKAEISDDRAFHVSLANPKDRESKLVVWTAYLDPASGRAADITVQPLRPGVKTTVNLSSSKPDVGVVQSPLTIESGKNHAVSKFTALHKGVTIISVETPAGFATPKNATRLPANVND